MRKLLSFLLDYKFTILLIAYLYLIISFPIYFTGGVVIILSIVPLMALVYILAKSKYHLPFTILFTLLIFGNAYFSFAFRSTISVGFLASIVGTNMAEATSVVRDALLAGVILLAITSVLIFGSISELKKLEFSMKYPILLFLAYSFIFLPYVCHRSVYKSGLNIFLDRNPIFVYHRIIVTNAPILYGNLAVAITYAHEISQFDKYKNAERVIPDGIEVNNNISTVEKIYLIIGESSNRSNYSLYGYPTKTTPFLDSLAHVEPSMLAFYDGIATATLTRNAVSMILSFANPDDMTPVFEQKTIIDFANLQGYETIWISNQGKVDNSDGIAGSYISRIASSSSRMFFNQIPFSDDLGLVKFIEESHQEDKRQLFLLHLGGSHISYGDKYDPIDKDAIQESEANTLDYDRSIHHTDRFLREVYNIMKKDPSSILYYLSDHGEVIGVGHGMGKYKDEYTIPLLTINNSAYPLDSLVNRYVQDETSLINAGNTIYIIPQLMGYQVDNKLTEEARANTQKITLYDVGDIGEFNNLK